MIKDLKKIGYIYVIIIISLWFVNTNYNKNKEIQELHSRLAKEYDNQIYLKKLIIEYDNRLNTCYDNVGNLNSYIDELNELEKLVSDLEKYQASIRR